MYHNDYIDAVAEYLRRYREFSQYIANVKTDIDECQRMLELEAAPATSSMSPTGGCGGGEKVSQEERMYMQCEDLQQIEPLIRRLDSSMASLKDINETDARILESRYIDDASWESTARYACCSVGSCRRRARIALKTLTGMMFGPDAVPMQTSVVFFKR